MDHRVLIVSGPNCRVPGTSVSWHGLARTAVCCLCLILVVRGSTAAQPDAPTVRAATGIETGLALVIGQELDLAGDLADDGRLLVHLLTPDARRVDDLAAHVQQRRMGGRVVVRALPADGHLPHPDRFVNLVIADLDVLSDRGVVADELMRVLATRGAAYLKQQGQWRTLQKPQDERLDGWTHRFYDATGNCVSRDRTAGFPAAVQWQHGPAMEDGCGNGKIPRIAAGRHVAVDTLTGDLVCRDAGNGTLLWRAALSQSPNADFAIVGQKVYLYYDAQADDDTRRRHRGGCGPLVALDVVTGQVVKVYDEGLRGGTAQADRVYCGRQTASGEPGALVCCRPQCDCSGVRVGPGRA